MFSKLIIKSFTAGLLIVVAIGNLGGCASPGGYSLAEERSWILEHKNLTENILVEYLDNNLPEDVVDYESDYDNSRLILSGNTPNLSRDCLYLDFPVTFHKEDGSEEEHIYYFRNRRGEGWELIPEEMFPENVELEGNVLGERKYVLSSPETDTTTSDEVALDADEEEKEEEREDETPRETPREFMDRYFEALYDEKYDELHSMSTDGPSANISMMEALTDMDGGDVNRTVDYRIDSVEQEADGGAVYNYTAIREDGSEYSSTIVIVNKGGGMGSYKVLKVP